MYDEYTQKKTAFDEKCGRLEHPELYYGWKQRGDELDRLREQYGKMLDHMDQHYMEMEVEPTFTFSGTAADVTPYQQQIDQMRSELAAYVTASNGLPDPSYVRQQQTNIARLQAALETLPEPVTAESLSTEWRQGIERLRESSLGQMGIAAANELASEYMQIYATGDALIKNASSAEGKIEQLVITMEQYQQERDMYLGAGLPSNHQLIAQYDAVIQMLASQIAYYESGQFRTDYNNQIQENNEMVDNLFLQAELARNRVVSESGTINSFLVDVGIESMKTAADALVGFVFKSPGAALTNQLVRSFGQGAHEAAENGGGVKKQIGKGLQSVVLNYLADKIKIGDDVYNGVIKSAAWRATNEISKDLNVLELIGSFSLRSMGEAFKAMVIESVDPVADLIQTGKISDDDIENVLEESLKSYFLNMMSEIVTNK